MSVRLGLDDSVPPYLRAEGFVRHRYISKKESEDIIESFQAEEREEIRRDFASIFRRQRISTPLLCTRNFISTSKGQDSDET